MAQDTAYFSDPLSHQLKFMNEAAHLMAVNAPACSSHIMSRYEAVMFANERQPSAVHRRHVCGGCGTIKIPAWTVDVAKESGNGRKKKMTKEQLQKLKERAAITPGAMVDICRRCNRKTRQSILKPAPQRITRRQGPASRPLHTTTDTIPASLILTSSATPIADSTRSKKRSKSRKQGGLQALLAKNKEAQSSKGFGLDLMDLMK